MPSTGTRSTSALAGRSILLVVALPLAGCNIPNFHGPQIQNPPPAFTLNREVVQERRMFPARAVVYHDAWVEASWGNFSGIYINGHPGVLGSAEVDGARRSAMEAATGKRVEFGEIESLTIDGRTAYGWGETWRLENGGLQYVVFRAAVPYDTISYAVDFITGDPGMKIRPDSLRTIVASFAIGKTTWNVPLIMVVAGVLLLLANTARSRRKARDARHRHIPLAKLPPKPAPDGPEGQRPADASVATKETKPEAELTVAEQIARQLEKKQRPKG
jgi:hypothetical protein